MTGVGVPGGEINTLVLVQSALWALLAICGSAKPLAVRAVTVAATLVDYSAQEKASRNPHGPLNIPCENCHTAAGWRPIRPVPEFDHNKTSYPLRGMHEKVKCVACHVNPVFSNASKNCADCHEDVHRRQMGPNCAQCHTVQGWNIAVQQLKDHQNRFPLLGAHAAVQCDDCHKSAAVGQYLGLSTACNSCHLADFQRTTNPNHVSAGFPQTCETCHTFDSWLGAKFDHSITGFPLTNGHASVPCASCHINNNYNLQIAPTDCGNAGCHLTTWQQTNNPVHSKAGSAFAPANCSQCHNTVSWNNAIFNHATTGFLLTNGHANVPCASCHINNNYNLQIAPTDCGNSQCHLTTWQKTNNPVHSTSGSAFATTNCANCHTTAGWDAASFDHSVTGFALTGTHATTPCAQCHVNNNYTLSTGDCMSCHTPAWNSTQTIGGNVPNHVASNFPATATACATCHPITVWSDGKFDHSATGFPLANSHQLAPAGKVTSCTQCHIGGNYTLNIQPTDCGNSQCHLTTWQQTNNPSHPSAGAPFATSNCSTCHNPTLWTNVVFDHTATGWALTGSHQMAPAGKVNACTDCHTSNNYNFTSANTDCYGCHQAAWNSTPNFGGNVPNHITAGFPTSLCSTCHDTLLWTDGKFDHGTTGFPLQGPHMPPPRTSVTGAIGPMVNLCTDCHIGGNYTAGYPTTDCYGCHQSYYTNAQNYGSGVPNHVVASYPTTCVSCHTTWVTTAWTGAVFNHTYFRIPHNGSSCSDCHINSTNYAVFSCINACHTGNSPHTNQTETNSNHQGVSGYTYNATICVNCHKG